MMACDVLSVEKMKKSTLTLLICDVQNRVKSEMLKASNSIVLDCAVLQNAAVAVL